MFTYNPPPGVCVYPVNDSVNEYKAVLTGPEDSPYEGGLFELDLSVSNRYPFEPPSLRFVTPIYHPNIDTTGRICLDLLKMPPAGNWQPSINICTLLTSVRLLMAKPNPLDPLMVDISEEYLKNNPQFIKKAKEQTALYACKKESVGSVKRSPSPDEEKMAKKVKTESEKKDSDSSSSEASWSDWHCLFSQNMFRCCRKRPAPGKPDQPVSLRNCSKSKSPF
ncbi:hypothetical protein WA588_003779 [Blastocystis sp. NMH]